MMDIGKLGKKQCPGGLLSSGARIICSHIQGRFRRKTGTFGVVLGVVKKLQNSKRRCGSRRNSLSANIAMTYKQYFHHRKPSLFSAHYTMGGVRLQRIEAIDRLSGACKTYVKL